MRGFGERADVETVLTLLDARTSPLSAESVPLLEAAGRVLAAPVVSAVDVPGFPRSAMDGFAVRAEDTRGAADNFPSLAVVGEALPARPFAGTVGPGQAVRIMTGAPIPAGADAVLMAEFAQEAGDRVLARASVSPGKHVVRVGEDVGKGREVLPAGRMLRPQDVGLLASIGAGTVSVVRRPRVAILVTGDELLPPGAVPDGFRIVDSNSPMLSALVARDGGECRPVQYLPDHYEAIRDALRDADADVVLVTGGSSVGTEDHAPRVVAELGELTVHGIAIRPASPTGIGLLASRVVFLLPGNPMSCLCAYDLFAGRVMRRLGGRSWELPYRRVTLPLAAKVTSAVGRVDYLRVRVVEGRVEPVAAGGASNLSSAVAADGFALVGRDRDDLAAGEMVEVWLYE
jgi:molybdopterin molybdotransferase